MNENVIAGTEQELRKRDACTCWDEARRLDQWDMNENVIADSLRGIRKRDACTG